MSGALADDVFRRDVPPGLARDVLIVFALHAHDDGTEARPALATVASKVGCGERTVKRNVKRWREAGVLKLERRPRRIEGRGSLPNVYVVDLTRVPLKVASTSGDQSDTQVAPTSGDLGANPGDQSANPADLSAKRDDQSAMPVRDVTEERPSEREVERPSERPAKRGAERDEPKPNGQPKGDTEIARLAAGLGWNPGRLLKFARETLGKHVTSLNWTRLSDTDVEKLVVAMREEPR